jgi:hypothetical protein
LAEDFVADKTPLESVSELSRREPFAVPKQLLLSFVQINASVEQLKAAAEALKLNQFPHAIRPPASNHKSMEKSVVTAKSPKRGSGLTVPSSFGSAPGLGALEMAAQGSPQRLQTGPVRRASSEDAGTSTNPESDKMWEAADDWHGDPLSAAFLVYEKEKYLLLPQPGGEHSTAAQLQGEAQSGASWSLLSAGPAFVMGIKSGATGLDKLQGLLQAVKLREVMRHLPDTSEAKISALLESLEYARKNVGVFVEELTLVGWNVEAVLMESQQTHELVIHADNPVK